MKFIEMTGATLKKLIHADEIPGQDLETAGVEADTIVRVNQQGDIEVRREAHWDVIGGLLGEFEARLRDATDLDWA